MMALPQAPIREIEGSPLESWQEALADILPEQLLTSSAEAFLKQRPKMEETRFKTGPITVVHAFWLAGMSCDGCSVAVTGATNPSVESLLTGSVATLPKLVLHHPVLSVEAGHEFVRNFELAAEGKLDAPYVVIFEGSVADERISSKTGGYWSGMGMREVDGEMQMISTAEWLERLAPGAAATIAIGTCATWGGVPAAIGNVTNSMGVMDFLGADYRSDLGLPVVNIPGCSPVGDNFTETVAAVLLFLQGLGPLPDFDELGRPAWLYGETVHRNCVRAGYYEEGVFAEHYGDKECLVEIGCWGPVVQCNITSRGAINHMGGCMNTGGICIGCTMPGFPDAFAPFYKRPPGTLVSSSASRTYGAVIRRLRGVTQEFNNRGNQWGTTGTVPSGWGHVKSPGPVKQAMHYFYEKLQTRGSGQADKKGRLSNHD
jgi:hydrogenase small subunit